MAVTKLIEYDCYPIAQCPSITQYFDDNKDYFNLNQGGSDFGVLACNPNMSNLSSVCKMHTLTLKGSCRASKWDGEGAGTFKDEITFSWRPVAIRDPVYSDGNTLTKRADGDLPQNTINLDNTQGSPTITFYTKLSSKSGYQPINSSFELSNPIAPSLIDLTGAILKAKDENALRGSRAFFKDIYFTIKRYSGAKATFKYWDQDAYTYTTVSQEVNSDESPTTPSEVLLKTQRGRFLKRWKNSTTYVHYLPNILPKIGENDVVYDAVYDDYQVSIDSVFNYTIWTRDGLIGSNADAYYNNQGFTLKSHEGVTEGTCTSPYFSITPGESYKIDIDIEGNNWDVYIFFCDAQGNWINFSDSTNRFSSSGTGNSSRIFTAPAGSVKAQIRCDANGSNNSVIFKNFRIYPSKYEYMSDSIYTTYRSLWLGLNPSPNVAELVSREGYHFIGLNTQPDGSGTWINDFSELSDGQDHFLYTQWEINKYTATFYDYQGNIIETNTVAHGLTPICSITPFKPSTAEYHYQFIGWQNIGPITQDTSYYPEYESIKRSYPITWVDGNNNKIYEEEVFYGVIPVYNQAQYGIPEKDETVEYKWDWQGWTITPSAVSEATIYYAYHAPIKQKYLITWINDKGSFLSDEIVEYGKTPKIPEDPISEFAADDEVYDYQFIGWDATPGDDIVSGVEEVIGVTIYQAVYSKHLKTFNLIISANPAQGGATIGTGSYDYGTIVDIRAIPSRGYLFHQWNDGIKTPHRAITVTQHAKYTAEFKKILCYWNTTPITEAYLNTTQITI